MRYNILTFFAAVSCCPLLWGAAINFPGDSLSQGGQYISTSTSMQDWYYSGTFIANAKASPIDDSARGMTSARDKGYGFSSELTYRLGITDNLDVGLRYGYEYDKAQTSIDSATGNTSEGEIINEGGTDLTLLGYYRMSNRATWDVEIQLPICSSESVGSVCDSELAVPENSAQEGEAGGQGNGFYSFQFGASANWLSMTDTHWMGRLYARAVMSDSIFGEKVSAPFTLGGQFGVIMPIKANHQWTLMGRLENMQEYSGYSEQLQRQVDYGVQSWMSLRAEYLWDVFNAIQLKPFVDFTMRQPPSKAYTENGARRRLEYTAGTLVTLGAQLSVSI